MKNLFIKLLFITIPILGISASAYAEPLKITVIASTKSEKNLDEVAASTIVIDEQAIRQSGAIDLADVLEQYAGFDVVRSGGLGQQTSVFSRGTESNHTLLIIDGVKVNAPSDGIPAWNFLNTGNIEKIEVVKGPRSTLYGSDAIGAVVSVTTKKGGENAMYASLEVGELGSQRVTAGSVLGSEKLYLSLDADFVETDGIPARTVSVEDHPHENTTAGIKVGGIIGQAGVVLNLSQADGNTAYEGGGGTTLDQDSEITTASLSFDLPLSDSTNANIILSSIENDLQQNQTNFLSQFDFTNSQRDSIDWQFNTKFNQFNNLVYGLSIEKQQIDSLSFGTAAEDEVDNTEIFFQNEILLKNDARFYIGGRAIDNENFGRYEVGNIEFVYPFAKQNTISFAYGTAFKTPTALDLFGFAGNVDLQPEESTSREINLRHYLSDSQSIRVGVFSNRIRNLINFNNTFTSLENLQRTSNDGFEVDYQHSIGHWRIDFSLINQDPKNDTNNTQLVRRAKESYKLSLLYDNSKYYVRLDTQKVGRRAGIINTSLDSYLLANLSAGLRLSKNLEISARIENVNDEDYTLANFNATDAFNTLERTAYLGINYRQ